MDRANWQVSSSSNEMELTSPHSASAAKVLHGLAGQLLHAAAASDARDIFASHGGGGAAAQNGTGAMSSTPAACAMEAKPEASECVSRKDKSLGLLCDNFLQLFASGGSEIVELEAVAQKLGVGRRRICALLPAASAPPLSDRSRAALRRESENARLTRTHGRARARARTHARTHTHPPTTAFPGR